MLHKSAFESKITAVEFLPEYSLLLCSTKPNMEIHALYDDVNSTALPIRNAVGRVHSSVSNWFTIYFVEEVRSI
jgi:hypothetical protein